MNVSDLILPLGIVGGTLLIVVIGVFVFWFIKRKKGGIDMKAIKKKLEVEEVEEPTEEPEIEDMEEIEDVAPQPKPQPKQPQTPICKVIVAGGKSYQGKFLGEEPQLITLPNGNLVKVESYWIIMQTEQLPYLRINRRFIILMAFTANPFSAPQPPPQKPKPEEMSLDSLEV